MATKSELQAAYQRCEEIRARATAELQDLNFAAALSLAEAALPIQHPAVTYQRRFLDTETPATPLVDLILRYAPAFFRESSLAAVESWYLGGTKTERAALPKLPDQIGFARNLLGQAVALWRILAASPTAVLRPTQEAGCKALLQVWTLAAIVAVHPNDPMAYYRVTDPRREAAAKCSSCGRVARGPQTSFLEPTRCPACRRRSDFVLIR
jgi:hypothetical protein